VHEVELPPRHGHQLAAAALAAARAITALAAALAAPVRAPFANGLARREAFGQRAAHEREAQLLRRGVHYPARRLLRLCRRLLPRRLPLCPPGALP
jgi:hypothetical protein